MPEDEKVIVAPDEPDTSQEKVDVTPAPKVSEEDQLASKIKADFEALYGSRISQVEKQFENFRHGAYRVQDDLKKENDRLKQQAGLPKPSVDQKDPWAGIENGQQWKAEIEKLAEEKAVQRLQVWQLEQQQQQVVQFQRNTQEASKSRVIAKYPDLHPDTGTVDSVVGKAYLNVLNEHPDWITNPYGPELAMYAMEEKLKAESTTTPAGGPAKSRTAATSLQPSRPLASGGERYTLTREQKAFCDRHSIKYEEFLKNATALEQGAVEA